MSFINKENIKTKYKALNLVATKLWVLHYYPPKRSFVLETKGKSNNSTNYYQHQHNKIP